MQVLFCKKALCDSGAELPIGQMTVIKTTLAGAGDTELRFRHPDGSPLSARPELIRRG